MPEESPHLKCLEHKAQCQDVMQLKNGFTALDSALMDRVRTKTLIGILSIFTLLLLAMFGYMADAISDSRSTVERIRYNQHETNLEIRELRFKIDNVHEEVKEVKETLKDNGFHKGEKR